MAIIDNSADWEASRAHVLTLDGPGLIAQHLVQRGAAHALETALEFGPTPEVLRKMLDDVRTMQDFVRSIAAMRGVEPVSED